MKPLTVLSQSKTTLLGGAGIARSDNAVPDQKLSQKGNVELTDFAVRYAVIFVTKSVSSLWNVEEYPTEYKDSFLEEMCYEVDARRQARPR